MKRTLALFLTLLIALSLCACGGGEGAAQEDDIQYYKLGDTVSTDIFEFTLNAAQFTIALNSVYDENRFTPKEYDPQDDADNPYVAPVGHTYAAFSYTVTNLNRASCEFHNGSFATVQYNGKKYHALTEGAYFQYADENVMDVSGKIETKKGGEWYNGPSINLLLSVGEKETRRACIDISTEIKDLTEDVVIAFAIPNSDGSKTEFTYLITEADRTANNGEEIEMTLDLALNSFTKSAGQAYFAEHMDEYATVSGNDISGIIGKKWDVDYIIEGAGHWSGTFWFEDNGKIKDNYGYENERTWEVDGDTIIINGEIPCEIRKVSDKVYLFVHNGSPYMLIQ